VDAVEQEEVHDPLHPLQPVEQPPEQLPVVQAIVYLLILP
jgi:hypothetical protein